MAHRLALALLAALPLAGCNLTIPLDVKQEYPLLAPPGVVALAQEVDLSQQETLWSEKDKVEGITVTQLEVTVVAIGPSNRAARADLQVRIRPDGAPADGSQDQEVAAFALSPVQPGQAVTVDAPGNPLGAAIMNALRGTGRFTLVLQGDVPDVLDATFRVRAIGSVDLGID